MCTFWVGWGVLTNWPPTIVTKLLLAKKVTDETVTNPLAAWLTFDQLSCKFENIGGVRCPPIGKSLCANMCRSEAMLTRYASDCLFFEKKRSLAPFLIKDLCKLIFLTLGFYCTFQSCDSGRKGEKEVVYDYTWRIMEGNVNLIKKVRKEP